MGHRSGPACWFYFILLINFWNATIYNCWLVIIRRPTVVRLSDDFRPIFIRLSSECRPTIVRLLSDCRLTVVRLSSDCRPTVVRLSSDCRPTVDLYNLHSCLTYEIKTWGLSGFVQLKISGKNGQPMSSHQRMSTKSLLTPCLVNPPKTLYPNTSATRF